MGHIYRGRAPIDCSNAPTRNGYGALLGSGGNEGIVGRRPTDTGKATSKATRGCRIHAVGHINSVLAACMCGFRQLLTAHSLGRSASCG